MFYKEWRDARWRIIILSSIFLVLLIYITSMFPVFPSLVRGLYEDSSVQELFSRWLPELPSEEMLRQPEFYLIDQWQGKNLGQLVPLIVLLLTFPIFSKDQDKKTLYFLLSGRTRTQVFWAKFWSGWFFSTSVVAGLNLMGPVVMYMYGYSASWGPTLLGTVQLCISAWFLYALFLFFSILFSDQVRPVVSGALVIVAFPLCALIPGLGSLNLFPYLLGYGVYQRGTIDVVASVVLMLLFVVMVFVDYQAFHRKEL